MVIMVMADDHHVGLRQFIGFQGGGNIALRAHLGGAGNVGEIGIGQDHLAAGTQDKGRMAEPGHARVAARDNPGLDVGTVQHVTLRYIGHDPRS